MNCFKMHSVEPELLLATKKDYKKSLMDLSRIYIIENFLLPLYLGKLYKENGEIYWVDKIKDNGELATLTSEQKEVLIDAAFSGETVVSKGRCTGFTTLLLCKIAAEIVLAEKGSLNIYFAGHDYNSTRIFIEKLEKVLSVVPKILWTEQENLSEKCACMNWDKGEITFKNGIKLFIVKPGKTVIKQDFSCANFFYLDEFFYTKDTDWKEYVDFLNQSGVSSYLIGSSPKNEDSEAFDFLKEKEDAGQRIHLFPLFKEETTKRILNLSDDPKICDEIFGTIKKEVKLENEEPDWIKQLKERL